jgi:hypothetical protein
MSEHMESKIEKIRQLLYEMFPNMNHEDVDSILTIFMYFN